MKHSYLFLLILTLVAAVGTLALWLGGGHLALFMPQGTIAHHELALMRFALWLMLLVVVPVFVLTGLVAWRYRASNTSAMYLPNWEHNTIEEAIWWLVPLVIIIVLAVTTWQSTHVLDPYKPLAHAPSKSAMTVQVVSLEWKWLFIYPAQGVASVNYLAIPEQTPVDFELTSDAPMNALWIPQLGGQEMTMPGMVTHLNLEADTTGTYHGLSSNYSGGGFADMQFPVHVLSADAFAQWASTTALSARPLTWAQYQALAAPGTSTPAFYALADKNLYTAIVNSFMKPGVTSQSHTR